MRTIVVLLALLLSFGLSVGCTKEEAKDTPKKDAAEGESKGTTSGPAGAGTTPESGGTSSTDSTQSPSVGSGPDAFFLGMQGAAGGNLGGIWDIMPAKYQSDINGLIKKVGTDADPELVSSVVGLVDKLGKVLDTKADMILANPMLPMMLQQIPGGMDPQALKPMLSTLGQGLNRISGGQMSDLENFEVSAFLKNDLGPAFASLKATAKAMPGMGEEVTKGFNQVETATFEVLENDGTTAKIKITNGDGTTETVDMVKVDGKFVPEEMARDWDQMMTDAAEGMSALTGPEAEQVKGMLTQMVHPMLDQLLAAQSANEFNAILGQAMQMMGGGGMPR